MNKADDLNARIAGIIEPSLESMGYELIRVLYSTGGRKVLQIMAERKEGGMSVDDCADVSRAVSALLDVEDPIADAYDLEVSSPGIDRPLTRLKDFRAWSGYEAKVEASRPIDGKKRFRGTLLGVDDDHVLIRETATPEAPTVGIPFSEVRSAKLVLTDALLSAAGGDRQ